MLGDEMDLGIQGLDHVCIIVRSIEQAARVYTERLGLRMSAIETVGESSGVRICFLDSGETAIELIEPMADNRSLSGFLQDSSARLHHIAFRVRNIEIAIAKLMASGVTFASNSPAVGAGGARIVFAEANAATGIQWEFVERQGISRFHLENTSSPLED